MVNVLDYGLKVNESRNYVDFRKGMNPVIPLQWIVIY